MKAAITLRINAIEVCVPPGTSVAAAIAHAGQPFRRSIRGQPRAPLCAMGTCFECRATIDGRPQQRTCLVPVAQGMRVQTGG